MTLSVMVKMRSALLTEVETICLLEECHNMCSLN